MGGWLFLIAFLTYLAGDLYVTIAKGPDDPWLR